MSLDANAKRMIAIVAGALLLAALAFFCVTLARVVALGLNNGPLGVLGIAPAGFLLGTAVLSCCSFAVRFGIKTMADYWRQGAKQAKRVRSRLETEYAIQRASQAEATE